MKLEWYQACIWIDLFFNRYVKTYLLPDKTKESKRKTSYRKATLNPEFDEQVKVRLRFKLCTCLFRSSYPCNFFLFYLCLTIPCLLLFLFFLLFSTWYPKANWTLASCLSQFGIMWPSDTTFSSAKLTSHSRRTTSMTQLPNGILCTRKWALFENIPQTKKPLLFCLHCKSITRYQALIRKKTRFRNYLYLSKALW